MEEFPQEELQEILREVYELKKDLDALNKSLGALSRRLEERQQAQQTQPSVDLESLLSRLREASDRLEAAMAKFLEELTYQRSLLLEELEKRDSLCQALLERVAVLQEELEKIRK